MKSIEIGIYTVKWETVNCLSAKFGFYLKTKYFECKKKKFLKKCVCGNEQFPSLYDEKNKCAHKFGHNCSARLI